MNQVKPSLTISNAISQLSVPFAVLLAVLMALIFRLIPIDALPLSANTLLETLYFSSAVAVLSVAWLAPIGEYRLRPSLVACLFLLIAFFNLLHFTTLPGMTDVVVANNKVTSFFFGRLVSFLLPCAMLAQALTPKTTVIPGRLRLSLLGVTLAALLPLAGYGFSLATAARTQTVVEGDFTYFASMGMFVLTAFIVRRYGDVTRPDVHLLVNAAVLGAIAEACLIPNMGFDLGNPLEFLSHVISIMAVAITFVAVYSEAVRHPFVAVQQEFATMHCDRTYLDTLLHSIADGVIVVDRSQRVLFANPVARHLIGKSNAGVAEMSLEQALEYLGSDSEVIASEIGRCQRNGRASSDIQYPTTAPSAMAPRAIEYSISPITGDDRQVAGVVLVLRDCTSRWQLQQQLLDAANYMRRLFEANPDPMFAIAADGRIADLNSAAEYITREARSKLVGRYFAHYFTDPDSASQAVRLALSGNEENNLALEIKQAGGSLIQVSCTVVPYSNAARTIVGAIATARDTTDMRQAELQLRFQADYDPLTALPNRRLFRDHIEQAVKRAQRDDLQVGVMIVDLDDFKDINDTLGHFIGDELLKTVGTRLAGTLSDAGMVFRIGGDEFGILVEDINGGAALQRLVGELVDQVTMPLVLAGRETSVTCSIGISLSPPNEGDADTLLRNADTAMFRAKECGKNNYQYFTADMNNVVQRRVELGHHLRCALRNNELSLYYQPQINLTSGAVVGVEALLRWNSAALGQVPPIEFIPVAEDTGLILAIGAWVIETACHQGAAWLKEEGWELKIAVNLSARQFRDEELVTTVKRALDDSGLPARLLELELTESMLMHDAGHATEIMTRLKQLGTHIAIDDFGTGYSSLSYLKHFPIDYLKVDRSFVKDTPTDTSDVAIVRSIVALAHGLDLRVIAEGVETVGQMELLSRLGCEEIQGYHVSPPLPANAMDSFLADWQQHRISMQAAINVPRAKRHSELTNINNESLTI